MKRVFSIIATVLAFGATIVGTSASATPAGADSNVGVEAWWDCPDGYFCAWYNDNGEDRGGDGKPEFYGKEGAPDLNKFKLNDHVRSVWNRTGVVWCAYPDINYADVNGPKKFPDPWPVGNWRGNTSEYNMHDQISSLHRGACRAS